MYERWFWAMKEQQLRIDLLIIEDALKTHSQNCGLNYSKTYGKRVNRLKSLLENRSINKINEIEK